MFVQTPTGSSQVHILGIKCLGKAEKLTQTFAKALSPSRFPPKDRQSQFLYIPTYLVFLVLLILAILLAVSARFSFRMLLVIWVSSFMKLLLRSFPHQ